MISFFSSFLTVKLKFNPPGMSVQSEMELRPYLIPAMNFISLAKVPKSQSPKVGVKA